MTLELRCSYNRCYVGSQVSKKADLPDAELEVSVAVVILVVAVDLWLKFLICLTWTRFPKGLHVETIETQKVKTCISANISTVVAKVKLM